MQLSDIRDEVRERMGVSPNDGFYSEAKITRLINSANRQIVLDQDWPWLQVNTSVDTTAGTCVLTMPANTRRVVRMSYQNIEVRYFVERVKPDWYDREGAPRIYTYEGGNWIVYPEPQQVYALDVTYVRQSDNVLSADTDVPLIPDYCIDALISKTCVMLARRERDLDLERNFFGEYMTIMDSMRDEQENTTEGMSPRRTRVEERMAYSGGWY